MAKSNKNIIFILGATGTGKSSLALDLARHLHAHRVSAEILSIDSVQIYKELDVASAKPDAAIRAEFKHHFIDVIPPDEMYSAGRYVKEAIPLIQDLVQRNIIPIVVGGTMFYAKSLVDGLDELPPSERDKRNSLVGDYLEEYLGEHKDPNATPNARKDARKRVLYEKLTKLQPELAKKIKPEDEQRVIRALDLHNLAQERGSSAHQLLTGKATGLKQLCQDKGWNLKLFALHLEDRAALRDILEKRFIKFVANGLVDELKNIRAKYPQLDLSYPALRAIGYREFWQYLETLEQEGWNEEHPAAKLLFAKMQQKAITATRRLAKHQTTWIRSWQDLVLLDASLSKQQLLEEMLGQVNL